MAIFERELGFLRLDNTLTCKLTLCGSYIVVCIPNSAHSTLATGLMEDQAAQECSRCLLSLDPVCTFDSSFVCSSK